MVQSTALRILEPIAVQNDVILKQLQEFIISSWSSAAPEMALQIVLTANIFTPKVKLTLLSDIAGKYVTSPLMRDAIISSLGNEEFNFLNQLAQLPDWKAAELNKEIFIEMLAAAIAHKGDKQELMALLTQLNTSESNYTFWEKAILSGMAIQAPKLKATPVRLKTEPSILTNSNEFSLSIQSKLVLLAQLFDWPGKPVIEKEKESQTMDQEALQAFAKGRTLYLGACAGCHGTDGMGLKRFAHTFSQFRVGSWR